ncbi:Damage response protein 1 [Wickerhamomyces ciferrii]|uniref:Damage response protein 1 n=1 Tax=Wickerhamomyces ciferrii (strain ATCC 14091 / BCRC 22168 / CBS 111 / JCM 3599 / NBRC 0793 / NRRL Y-1031 F-60-10) TaxID=1206466 RepID=K0KP97_WICCF|nr:Damage response protein 1 [Wickerhamomyces ciferrii]CCH42958.1 Damage response protein 1 [Wickerhamomyces ciferrii]
MSFIKEFFFPSNKTEDPTADDSTSTTKTDPIVEGIFTPRTLSNFNGHDDPKIFMAVKGTVYDVSAGRSFYGPSGPYSNFAGHDASRDNIREFHEPIDPLDDLTPQDKEALDGWEEHFQKKYPVVGKLVPGN